MKSMNANNYGWTSSNSSNNQASEPLMQSAESICANSRQVIFKNGDSKKGVKFTNVDSIEIFDGDSPIKKKTYKWTIVAVLLFIALFLTIIAIVMLVDVWFINPNRHRARLEPFASSSSLLASSNDSDSSNHTIVDDYWSLTTNMTTSGRIGVLKDVIEVSTGSNEFRWQHCGQTNIASSIDPSVHRAAHRRRHRRIIGGEDAVAHSYPFLASVRVLHKNGSEHHCGGTLITDSHVLTAAHCVLLYVRLLSHLKLNMSQIFSLIEVHVGINQHVSSTSNITEDDSSSTTSSSSHLGNDNVYGVEWFDWHTDFKFTPSVLYNDIAILKLNRPVNLNRPQVNVVCLPDPSQPAIKYGDNVVAIGWGTYAEDYNYTAYVKDDLQQAVFQVKDERDEACVSGSIGDEWDREKTVCAHGTIAGAAADYSVNVAVNSTNNMEWAKKSTCYGDSGGPVLAYRHDRWFLVGIISFGHDTRDSETNKKKCNASMPFYFVNVSAYYDWISRRANFTLLQHHY